MQYIEKSYFLKYCGFKIRFYGKNQQFETYFFNVISYICDTTKYQIVTTKVAKLLAMITCH